MSLPASVKIREVGPRDGFQNEPEVIATDDKVRLIDLLARTGRAAAGGDELRARRRDPAARRRAARCWSAIDVPDGVDVTVLVPNERGLDNALALRERFHEVNVLPVRVARPTTARTSTARSRSR